MNLFDRIIYQKEKGDSSNYDKVFIDLRSMMHSVQEKFSFDYDGQKIMNAKDKEPWTN